MKWVSRAKAAVGLNILPAPLRKLIVAVIGITILLLGAPIALLIRLVIEIAHRF